MSGDVATVLLHDSVADAEPEAGSLSNILRGVERIEDSLRIFNSRPIVGKLGGDKATAAGDFES